MHQLEWTIGNDFELMSNSSMKILNYRINPSGMMHVQVQHGIWPLCFRRDYYGRDDDWHYDEDHDLTFIYKASQRVRAELKKFYEQHAAQDQL